MNSKKGRPVTGRGCGQRTYCCHGICDTSRMTGIGCEKIGVSCIPFPKPCLKFRTRNSNHVISKCNECTKANKWLKRCKRVDGRFEKLEQIRDNTFICSLHFEGGKGPTEEFPDPVPAKVPAGSKDTCRKRKDPPTRLSLGSAATGKYTKLMKLQNSPLSMSPDITDFTSKPASESASASEIQEILNDWADDDAAVLFSQEPDSVCSTGSTKEASDAASTNSADDEDLNSALCYGSTVHEVPIQAKSMTLEVNENVEISINNLSSEICTSYATALKLILETPYYVSCTSHEVRILEMKGPICIKQVVIKTSGDVGVEILGKPLIASHHMVMDLKNIVTAAGTSCEKIKQFTEWLVCWLKKFNVCLGIVENDLVEEFKTLEKNTFGYINNLTGSIYSNKCISVSPDSEANICASCRTYKKTLTVKRNTKHKDDTGTVSLFTNYRFMSRKQLENSVFSLRQSEKVLVKKILIMQEKISKLIQNKGQVVQSNDCQYLQNVLKKGLENLQDNDFMKIFITQQLEAIAAKSKSSVRWHPTIIKLCVYWESKSPGTYDALRNSGFMALPSRKTVRKYADFSLKPGFQNQAFEELIKLADLEGKDEHFRYVALVHDEMKINEDIVYDKHTGELLGFVHTGNPETLANDQIHELLDQVNSVEPTELDRNKVASHVLQLMVCGLTSNVCFPLAYFPCHAMQTNDLHTVFWEAVKRLEIIGFRVLLNVCDGAGVNRSFFRLNAKSDSNIPYKTLNIYATDEERYIYFISDVPHLLKTTRNCVSHSGSGKGMTRRLWNGEEILWKHFITMYNKDILQGERFAPRISRDHIFLTSFLRMRVRLATQILSATCSHALEVLVGEGAKETSRLCKIFNDFFDIMNSRNLLEGRLSRNDNIKPIADPNDSRLKWLEEEFLVYLDDWELAVEFRDDRKVPYSPAEKKQMLLSRETRDGLRITTKSTLEYVRFLLAKGAKFVLTSHGNQDRLEQYFAMQRSCAGSNENPTVERYGQNVGKLKRIQNVAPLVKRGNVEIVAPQKSTSK